MAATFVPATEHVLTGVVLLAFALGWALLAVLSVRFSDQPQRWAAAPAVFFAVADLISLLPPRRSRLERPNGRPAGRRPHCGGPAHPASTCPGPWAVRAGRPFLRRPVRPKLRRQFPDQVAGLVLLDSTAPKPGPAPPPNTDPYDVIGRVAALSAASAHLGAGRLLNPFSYTTLPPRSGTRPAPPPRPRAPWQAPLRSMQWRTPRCSRRRP